MNILPFDKLNKKFIKEAAELLIDCFPQAYAECADEEMENILNDEQVVFMTVEDNCLIVSSALFCSTTLPHGSCIRSPSEAITGAEASVHS